LHGFEIDQQCQCLVFIIFRAENGTFITLLDFAEKQESSERIDVIQDLAHFCCQIFGLKTFLVNEFCGFNGSFCILMNNRIEKQDGLWFFHEDLSREIEKL
jgi:hypothetical protein